jgi:hypothetical protein
MSFPLHSFNITDADMLMFANSFNEYITTDDGSVVTASTPMLRRVVYDIAVNNVKSRYDLLMQAYVGRFLISSGEKVYASLVDRRMKKKDAYSSIRYVLLEIMLSITVAALIFVLSKK